MKGRGRRREQMGRRPCRDPVPPPPRGRAGRGVETVGEGLRAGAGRWTPDARLPCGLSVCERSRWAGPGMRAGSRWWLLSQRPPGC